MINDLRYAFRILRKNPGFVAVAILSLAIGIGANSAIYSFADTFLLRPLPIMKPSQVVTVDAEMPGILGSNNNVISYPDYVDLRDRNHTFDGLIASSFSGFGFAPDRSIQPRIKYGMSVSGNFFKVLGIEPTLGRGFLPDEDRVAGRDAVAVLSHDLWVNEFAANPAAVGRKIQLDGIEFTVVGVAPEAFTGMSMLKPALYVPLAMSDALSQTHNLQKRDVRWLELRGRLKSGVGISQAAADVSSIANALRGMYPKEDENLKIKVETEFQLRAQSSPPDTALVIMLGVLAVCVLLVACANVAGLLLSRATVRAREMAVRLAVGSSRWLLIRQLFTENLLLALGGGLAGLAVAVGAVKFFNSLPLPTEVPVDLTFRLDERALWFTFAVAVASTFLFGLTPALQGTRLDIVRALKEREGTGSKGSRLWGRNIIVSGQVCISMVLLIVSGILVAGFQSQLDQGPGFRTGQLQLMSFDPSLLHYTEAQRDLFYKRLVDQTRQASEVKSAALASAIPLAPNGISTIGVIPDGRELKRGERAIDILDAVITPGYFESMAIPLVQGRDFLESDQAASPQVAIVNEQFARHYWPNENAIGKRIRLKDAAGKQVEVVGVAKVCKYVWISEPQGDFVYLPSAQNPQAGMTLIAQTKNSDAATLVPTLRQIVQGLDRSMPVFEVRTMQSLYESRAVATPRIITRTVAGMGLMGLILAVVGLYGVVSYSVSRRSREFGIRMAVGADKWKIVSMVLRQGLALGLAGLSAGVVLGVLAAGAIRSSTLFSFSISIAPFVDVSLLLLLAVVLSACVPARRASLIDPNRALRDE